MTAATTLVAAVAFAGAVELVADSSRVSLPGSDRPEYYSVDAVDGFVASYSVQATLADLRSVPVIAMGGEGTVTSLRGAGPFENFDVIGTRDNEPVVLVASSRPPWRDFVQGAEGADVDAFRAAVQALIGPQVLDGPLTCGELAGIHEAIRARAPSHAAVGCAPLALSSLFWTAMSSGVLLKSTIELGQAWPARGEEMFSAAPRSIEAHGELPVELSGETDLVATLDGSTILGEVVVDGRSVIVTLPGEILGMLPEPEDVGGERTVPLRISSAVPVDVLLAPGALVDVSAGGQACLRPLSGRPIVSRVVGSRGSLLALQPTTGVISQGLRLSLTDRRRTATCE